MSEQPQPIVQPGLYWQNQVISGNARVHLGPNYITGGTQIWQTNVSNAPTVFEWFSSIKYWLHHDNMCNDLHPNTGTWLLNREEYVEWKSARESSVLWLHGIPGCGKSKLVAHVINDIKMKMNPPVGSFAYFYCVRDAAEEERSRPEEVIRSVLRQLSFTSTDQMILRECALLTYEEQKEKAKSYGSASVEKLNWQQSVQLLVALLEGSPTIIVIDAIDELKDDDRWRLFEAFDEMLTKTNDASVRIFVSSRDNGDIKMKLAKYTNVYIRATDNQDDIRRFVNLEVANSIKCHRLLRGSVPEWLRKEIISILVSGAQGMFRWVSLQIQALCSPNMKTIGAVKNALKLLPKTLEESYDVVYNQILELDSDARTTAQNAVRWLLCAKRPLIRSEFLVALSISKVEQSSPLPDQDPQSVVEELLDICCNLVVLDESVNVFRMAHLSVREYFESKPGFGMMETNNLALEACIDTLMTLTRHDEGFNKFKFYAAMFWPEHCQDIGIEGPKGLLREKMKLFLVNEHGAGNHFERWATLIDDIFRGTIYVKASQRRKLGDSIDTPLTAQLIASSYGLSWIVHEMVKSGSFVHTRRITCGDTGFNIATIWGYKSIVEEFLRAGADIEVPGNDGRTPLIIAAEHGHQDLVLFLISNGANINARWTTGRTPLHEAIYWGQYNIAKLLLNNGADLGIPDNYGVTPLVRSLTRDNTFVAGAFYDGDGIFIPDTNKCSKSLAYSGDMLRLLLDYGADPCDPANGATITEAVKAAHSEAVRIFVTRGADVNDAPSGEEERPLDYALGSGLSGAVDVLVNHGAIPGLRWDRKSYHILQWVNELWYPNLLNALDLGEGTKSAPFIAMPEATETHISREEEVVVTKDSFDTPYIWLRIPSNIASVSSIRFTTESHDQGWSDTASTLRGTYEQSFTWFEAGFTTRANHSPSRLHIQSNRNAIWEYQTHVTVWDERHADRNMREALAALQPGDAVQVYAKAAFTGWQNFVKRVEIEIIGVESITLPRRPTFPKL